MARFFLLFFFFLIPLQAGELSQKRLAWQMEGGDVQNIEGLNKLLKTPPVYEGMGNREDTVFVLRKLISCGRIKEFYLEANKIIPEMEKDSKKRMWIFCLVASAPLMDCSDEDNIRWLGTTSNVDYRVKEQALKSFSSREIKNDNNTEAKLVLDLFLNYSAVILKQFREESDPLFCLNYQLNKNRLLFFHQIKTMNNDEAKIRKNFNKDNIRMWRQRFAEAVVRNEEKSFVSLLIKFYPSDSVKVKKYLKLAGYEDREIPCLLDRTIGRVPKAGISVQGISQTKE